VFIFNGKKILKILLLIFIILFIFTYIKINKEKTIQTVSLPVTGKVVVLDAGHGVPDERSTK
jgi:hypothetical protein